MVDHRFDGEDGDDQKTVPSHLRDLRDFVLSSHALVDDLAEQLRSRDLRRMSPDTLVASQKTLQQVLDSSVARFMGIAHLIDRLADVLEEAEPREKWERD